MPYRACVGRVVEGEVDMSDVSLQPIQCPSSTGNHEAVCIKKRLYQRASEAEYCILDVADFRLVIHFE